MSFNTKSYLEVIAKSNYKYYIHFRTKVFHLCRKLVLKNTLKAIKFHLKKLSIIDFIITD